MNKGNSFRHGSIIAIQSRKSVEASRKTGYFGSCYIDEDLGRHLTKNYIIDVVKDDLKDKDGLKKDFESLLNEKGVDLWDTYFVEHDTVRTLADDPARETDVDILGRKTFAKALVERIVQIREEEKLDEKRSHKSYEKRLRKKGAFLMHIHGPWGSGKSSLLNFMRHEMEEEIWREKKEGWIFVNFYRYELEEVIDKESKNKWIVVMFNAWQHQRTGPPWWSLMDAVFKRGVSSLRKISWWRCITIVLWEYSWRLWKGTSPILWGSTIVLLFLGLGIWFGFFNISSLINPGKSNGEPLLLII